MRVLVIGAGVFGAWSAKFLADAGHHVTLVDAYGPANGRASSSDYSRVYRAGYGGDEIYSRWAIDARADWLWLSELSAQQLFVETGALFLGEPGNAYVRATRATLERLHVPTESLDGAELHTRFPQIDGAGLGDVLFEAQAGVIRARAAVRLLVQWIVRQRGVNYVVARVEPIDESQATLSVVTRDGAELQADAYVFACGPWLSRVFPQAVGARVRATRQEVLYFGAPAGRTMFAVSQLPVWIDFGAGYYGIPDLDALGFKVGVDRHGPPVDPDTLDRLLDPKVVARTRDWMARRFPGMRGRPLVDGRVCQYENTSSGDFIIDRHPQWPECWIVGGGSGHGFKHGPSVGRHVAALIGGTAALVPRFALASKTADAARQVY